MQPQLPRALMDALQAFAEREVHSVTSKEHHEVLYLCGLLQLIGDLLTVQCRGPLLELLLTVPMKGNTVLYVQVMRTVVALTGKSDGGQADLKLLVLIDRLLTALLDFAPHQSDIEGNAAYAETVVALMGRLGKVHATKAGQQLLAYFELYSGLLLSPKPSVVRIAAQTLSRTLHAGGAAAVDPDDHWGRQRGGADAHQGGRGRHSATHRHAQGGRGEGCVGGG